MNRLKTLRNINQWFLHVVIARFSYGRWITLREDSKDE